MKTIGIYSFPKSGNTWIREVVHSLYVNQPANNIVTDVYEGRIGTHVVKGPDGADITFYKSHGCRECLQQGPRAIVNDAVVYIVRHPLDVFMSQANYIGKNFVRDRGPLEVSFTGLNDLKERGLMGDFFSAYTIFGTLMPTFQDAGSWMDNARHWLTMAPTDRRVVVLRYEKLITDFAAEFRPVADLLGFTHEQVSAALSSANDRCNDGGNFFFRKETGYFREYLSDEQIAKFQRLHRDVLDTVGYSDL
jgi:hypothetical protein